LPPSKRATRSSSTPPVDGKLFLDHVLQADEGCDFDFLRGA
jgi:hypothetical protein